MRTKLIILSLIVALTSSFNLRKVKPTNSDFRFFNLKSFEKSLIYIPDKFLVNINHNSGKRRFTSYISDTITVGSFYICQTELTNMGYFFYLKTLREKNNAKFLENYPDTSVWRSKFFNLDNLTDFYLRSPNTNNHPVVGITYEQAEEYCKWLTEEYARDKNRKFKNAVFKLPTKAQWLIAAIGNNSNRELPWDGQSMYNENGQRRANFMEISQTEITRVENFIGCHNSSSSHSIGDCLEINQKEGNSYPNPVNSLDPNDYGIYNIVGNVAEYVREYGITKGGGFEDPGFYLLLNSEDYYTIDSIPADMDRGFRIVMELEN